jgi:hypothetical protein
MAPFYNKEDLEKFSKSFSELNKKHDDLFLAVMALPLKTEQAEIYRRYGVMRRIRTLFYGINAVYEVIPPELDGVPETSKVIAAATQIQAFVLNVFGLMDNLAWVWIHEKQIKYKDKEVPATMVGLGPKNEFTRSTFSMPFQEYLKSLDEWRNIQEEFRHSLAHRIPLYIPPYTVTRENTEKYEALELAMREAIKARQWDKYEALERDQANLSKFLPIILHSPDKPFIYFHAQLLADFATVDELTRNFMKELEGKFNKLAASSG